MEGGRHDELRFELSGRAAFLREQYIFDAYSSTAVCDVVKCGGCYVVQHVQYVNDTWYSMVPPTRNT